jgi:hypothetical protein
LSSNVKIRNVGRKTFLTTMRGTFAYPAFVTPDTYKDNRPKFKTAFVLPAVTGGKLLEAMRKLIDPAVDEWRRENKRKKAFDTYLPGSMQLDEEGDETGNMVFNFSTGAFWTNRQGQEIKRIVPMFDGRGNRIAPGAVNPWSGTEGKLSIQAGQVWDNDATKQVGYGFYLESVQILKLVEGHGGSESAEDAGFDSDDDGEDLSGRVAEIEETVEDMTTTISDAASPSSGDLDDEIPF